MESVHSSLPPAMARSQAGTLALAWPSRLPVWGQVWVMGTCLATGILASRPGTPAPTYFTALEPATVT